MTSNKSLFSRGIYKNVLSRFKWGGFLYLVFLFFSTVFPIIISGPSIVRYSHYDHYDILLHRYGSFPYILTYIVPVVVAVLIFGHLHSAKQGIFIHSLPVSRKAIYISSILGGFTLMLAPIAICTVILLILSGLGEYSYILSAENVLQWFLFQFTAIFIFFAYACFSGVLTGHGAAHIGVNVVLHIFPLLISYAIMIISDIFLYGFTESDNFIADKISDCTPFVWIGSAVPYIENFLSVAFVCYMVFALILYGLGYYLYTKRKIELCGEVAAFGILRPILKYTVTSAMVLVVYGILASAMVSAVTTIIVTALFGAIAYFGCEMIMSKTIKVFDKFRGYLVFCGCTALVFCFFAFTDVLGYETRLPDEDNIEAAMVNVDYHYYFDNEDLLTDPDTTKTVLEFHRELIHDIPGFNNDYTDSHLVFIKYKLKNGRTLERQYPVTAREKDEILKKLHTLPAYKYHLTGIDDLNIENVTYTYLSSYNGLFVKGKDASELMQAVKDDIKNLTYDDITNVSDDFSVSITISCKENKTQKIFVPQAFLTGESSELHTLDIKFDSSFVKTMEFIKSREYYDMIIKK